MHFYVILFFDFFQEEERARDLFFALWIPDLFMKRVESNGNWSLMCPDQCPGLADCWGKLFLTVICKIKFVIKWS